MSCATVGDVREVAESVDQLATAQADRSEAVAAALTSLASTQPPEIAVPLTEIAARLSDTAEVRSAGTRAVLSAQVAEDRSGSILAALLSPGGAAAGLLSLGSTLGLHLYRNRTRRRAMKTA